MSAIRRTAQGFSLIELILVLAIATTLMALGTPILRGALVEARLRGAANDMSNALAKARREAFRTSEIARVEVDPADGRISVFARDTATDAIVERRRLYLPPGVGFNNVGAVTNYNFDTLGRPAVLPMTVQVRSLATGVIRTVTVLGSGRVNVT
jgi:prepilin-type N-terminal cleavage/methylation domain-containing protein